MANTTRPRRGVRRARPALLCLMTAAIAAPSAMAAPPVLPDRSEAREIIRLDTDGKRQAILDKLSAIPLQTKAGAPIAIAGGGSVRGIPAAGSDLNVIPTFATPVGGRAIKLPAPKRAGDSRIVLSRADGSTYAQATLNHEGRYDEITYFDGASEPVLSVFATAAEGEERSSSHSHEAKGSSQAKPKTMTKAKTRTEAGKRAAKRPAAKAPLKGAKKPAAPPSKRDGVHRQNAHCATTGSWATHPWRLYGGGMGFYISYSMPAGYGWPILYGADNWNSMQNWCNVSDQSNIALNYQGWATNQLGIDGANMVDFGPVASIGGICAQPDVAACAVVAHSGGYPYEVDIRMSNQVNWFVNGQAPPPLWHLDVEGTMTHEFGHALGLAHVANAGEVMNYVGQYEDITDRQLGAGETAWTNANY